MCEKLQLDIERRQNRVVDAELIRRSLQDFERLVNLLPLEDQKELFQLLIREVEVHCFDPAKEKLRKARGAFATRVRSKWYRVNVTLHQLPGVDLGEQAYIVSSDNKRTGSPARTRTWNLAVNSRPLYRLSYRGARLAHYSPHSLAAEPGFEPGPRDPKSRVLPLHHSALGPPRFRLLIVAPGQAPRPPQSRPSLLTPTTSRRRPSPLYLILQENVPFRLPIHLGPNRSFRRSLSGRPLRTRSSACSDPGRPLLARTGSGTAPACA